MRSLELWYCNSLYKTDGTDGEMESLEDHTPQHMVK